MLLGFDPDLTLQLRSDVIGMCAHVRMHTTLVTHAFGHQVSSLDDLQNVLFLNVSFPLLSSHPLLLHYAPSFMTMISNENKNNPSPPNVSYPWNLSLLEIGQSPKRNLGTLSVVSLLFSPQGRQGMKGRRHLRAVSLESPKQGLGGRVKNSARMWDLKSQSRSSRPLRTMRLDERGVMCNC